jgi:hypothetical protein
MRLNHRLMKRVHPDVGGSSFFAKQLNAAREALLHDALTADDNREAARRERQADRKPQRGEDVEAIVTVPAGVEKNGGFSRVVLPSGRAFEVKIPAGVGNGAQPRLSGLGAPGVNGGEHGDALIKITIDEREAAHLHKLAYDRGEA